MFGWFKKNTKGPDYSGVDSREKAEALVQKGELQKLLLLPAEFGGEDVPPNVVYVPAFAVELKANTDQNIILPLAQEDTITRYNAAPEYEGKSFIPAAINIEASEPGSFTYRVAIWGKALDESSKTA
ncbi:hypothetical protein ACGLWX_05715 [Halomonas sp. HMF6819]|uniref:hypothetical protein n=1 Tax=Halomonas sp. HMF6819 TaxID=3373085 RepID=UPI0037AB8E67